MNIKNKTLKELKELCKKNNIKNYSKLDKINLIKLIKKNMKGGEENNDNEEKYINREYDFNGILNRKSLTRLLRTSETYLIERHVIDLSECGITEIELDTFNGLNKLKILKLDYNLIKKIELYTFNGLKNLRKLTLKENIFTELDKDIFNGLNELEELELSGNIIKKIKSCTFNGLSKLKRLNLNNINIEEIKLGTFNGLNKLEYLSLTDNKITKIESGTFEELSKLKLLNLDWNKIAKIESYAFKGLSELETLNLSYNKIAKIELGTFEELSKLKLLYLDGNKIAKIEVGAFDGLSIVKEISLGNLNKNVRTIVPTTENIRSYNNIYYLYQKIHSIQKNIHIVPDDRMNIVPTNKTKIIFNFHRLLYPFYLKLLWKIYIGDFHYETMDDTTKFVVKNNYIKKKFFINNDTEITNISLKEYLIQESKFIHQILYKNNNNNNNNNIKILKLNIISIELLNKYLIHKNKYKYKKKRLYNLTTMFTLEELLILFGTFDYLDIQDREDISYLCAAIVNHIKDFSEEELITLFGFKKTKFNNSQSLINKNQNKNCEELYKNNGNQKPTTNTINQNSITNNNNN